MRRDEAVRGSDGGLRTGDYADMSNEKPGENPGRRNPKASRGRFVRPGSHLHGGFKRDVGEGQRLGSTVIPSTAGNGRTEDGLARPRPRVHASKKSIAILTCWPYQNRHRWEGAKIPRRAGETSLRNSAT